MTTIVRDSIPYKVGLLVPNKKLLVNWKGYQQQLAI